MSGQYYRAKARTGGLAAALEPVANLFKAIQDQKRKEQWIKDVQNVKGQLDKGYGDIDNATQEQNFTTANPAYTPYSEPDSNIPINIFSNKPIDFARPQNNEMVTAPTFNEKRNVPLSDVQKYNKAQELGNKTAWDILMNHGTKDYGDNNILRQLMGEVNQRTEQFRPKPTEWRTLAPGATSEEYDYLGNPTGRKRTNPKEEAAKNPYTKVSRDGYYMIWDDKTKGFVKTKEKAPAKEYLTDKQINGDSSSEKDKSPIDISKELIDLESNWNNLQVIRKMPDDQEDSDGYTTKDKREILYGNIKAQTDGLANKINSKYPGFEEIYNLLFQNPKMKAGKVDEVVEETMKGAPSETKNWMKKILNKRVF